MEPLRYGVPVRILEAIAILKSAAHELDVNGWARRSDDIESATLEIERYLGIRAASPAVTSSVPLALQSPARDRK